MQECVTAGAPAQKPACIGFVEDLPQPQTPVSTQVHVAGPNAPDGHANILECALSIHLFVAAFV